MKVPRHILLFKILDEKKQKELTVSELNTVLGDKMSWATLFKAIEDLKVRDLVSTRKEGNTRIITKKENFYICKKKFLNLYDCCLDEKNTFNVDKQDQ